MKSGKKGKRLGDKSGRNPIRKVFCSLAHMLLYAGCGILCTGCGAEETPVSAASETWLWEVPGTLAGIQETVGIQENVGMQETVITWDMADGIVINAETKETDAEDDAESETPFLEQLFTYEEEGYWDDRYLVITGIAGEYEDGFWQYMEKIRDNYGSKWYLVIPSDANGIPVREIADGAFADRQMYGVLFPDTVERIGEDAFRNGGLQEVQFSENLEWIGARAFENCNLSRAAFPDVELAIEERAFAGNRELWTVLIPNVETKIGENVFENCASKFLLCYGTGQEEKRNTVLEYAEENGFETMAIIASKEPVIRYHDEPLVLRPTVRNFFYGDDGEEDQWCTWEEDTDAPNFGYSDWQWSGCSSWCGCLDFVQEAEASSELASADGRYAAGNMLWQNREAAWAEGVDGPGIGESITYLQSCTYGVDNKWERITPENREPIQNGLYDYTEICIVNGYARNQKTWEENGRIKRLAMYVEGQLYAYLELEDTMFPQYFFLPEGDIVVPNRGMLEVRFEIEEVYPGSRYEDTCLTGLVMEFSGRYSH